MARKAAGAAQTEEQRPNPLKHKVGKGKETWSQVSVTEQHIIFSLELVVGHHPRLVAGSWLYQGKPFTANEKFCRNSYVVSGVHSEDPPRY